MTRCPVAVRLDGSGPLMGRSSDTHALPRLSLLPGVAWPHACRWLPIATSRRARPACRMYGSGRSPHEMVSDSSVCVRVAAPVDAAIASPLTTPSDAFPSTTLACGNSAITARRTYGARDMPPVR